MMNFDIFTKSVLERIQKKTDGMFDVSISNIIKNNGIKYTGISAMAKGSSSGPCVYLDGCYREYKNGNINLQNIVDEVYRQIREHQNDLLDINVMDFLNWKNIRDRVYSKLVNTERNKEKLDMIPHRTFLDMTVVYYVSVSVFENQATGAVLIDNCHMSSWKQDEETLFQTAMANMRSDGNPVFENMDNFLRKFVPEVIDFWESEGYSLNKEIYILTNSRKNYGASEILDKNTLRKIADIIRDDYIVLPSSLHEVLVLTPGDKMEYEELADMVKEINATEVDKEDYLSDHVYIYIRSEESLKIAA